MTVFFFFFFLKMKLILQSKAEEIKGKPAKQDREAYQIEQLDLKKGGGGNPFPQVGRAIPTGKLCQFVCCRIK